MKNLILQLFAFVIFTNISFAQIGINSDASAPSPSAQLDIKSIEKGLLIPRMTSIERNTIQNPEIDLMVFDKDLQEIFIYNSDGWKQGTLSKLPLNINTGTIARPFSVENSYSVYPPIEVSAAGYFKHTGSFGNAIYAINSGNAPTIKVENNGGSGIEASSNGFGFGGYFSSINGTAIGGYTSGTGEGISVISKTGKGGSFKSDSGIGIYGETKNNYGLYVTNNSFLYPTARFINNGSSDAVQIIGSLKIYNEGSEGIYISQKAQGSSAIVAEGESTTPTIKAKAISLGSAIYGYSQFSASGHFESFSGRAIVGSTGDNYALFATNTSNTLPTAKFTNNTPTGIAMELTGNIILDGKIIQEAYQSPTFEKNWSNYGGEWATAKFYKNKEGRVYLEGSINGGNNPKIYTLPAEYRPNAKVAFMVTINGSERGRIEINSNGDVYLANGSTTQVSLDGISFRVE